VEGSDVTHPDFRCAIISTGCNSDDDCHVKLPYNCKCRGDTCFRYHIETNSYTGISRNLLYSFTESGWEKQGYYVDNFNCLCDNKDAQWETIWHTDEEINVVPTEATKGASRYKVEL